MSESFIYCEHANEMPQVCPCEADCVCKRYSCATPQPWRPERPAPPTQTLDQQLLQWKLIVSKFIDDLAPSNAGRLIGLELRNRLVEAGLIDP